jgi:hypothetical protein
MVGTFAMVGMKLGPVYLDNYAIKGIVKSLGEDPLVARKSVFEIRRMIFKRLDINHITHIKKEHVKIKRIGGETTVELKYEARRHLAGNLDAVMSFHETIKLTAN